MVPSGGARELPAAGTRRPSRTIRPETCPDIVIFGENISDEAWASRTYIGSTPTTRDRA